MSGLFFLGSFLAYLKYRSTQKVPYLGVSSLGYACALLTKETAITLLLILILFNLVFPHGDTFKKRFFSLLPYFLLSLIYLISRVYFFGSLQYGSRPVRPLYDNLLSQSRAWVHYLGTLILPLNLNVDYDFRVSHSILESQVILSIFLLVAISLLIWRLSRSNRLVGFFALWFAITLLPTNSVIALEDLVTDRWLYLSSVGYAVLLALTVDWVFQKWVEQGRRAGKIVFFFLCALVIELYGSSTFLRNFTWANQRTLWEDAAAKSPHKARPYNSLGIALIFEGRLEEASQSLDRAITLAPQEGQAYINLGSVYMRQGKMEKALDIFQKAIPLNPLLLSDIYNNLGLIYFTLGRMEEGERASQKSIEIRPHHAAPYYNLGVYHEKKGDIDQAIYYYEISSQALPRLYPVP